MLLLVLGFGRDFVFVNLNYQASKVYYHQQYEYKIPTLLSFIETWSYTKLYYAKWGLTILFTVVYALITYLFINAIFNSKLFNKLTIFIYLVIIGCAFIAFLLGYFLGDSLKGYTISRQLMGIVQSPLVLMFLLPALYLNKNKQ